MLSCRLQCALAALSIVLALGGVTGAPSDPRLRQFLQKSLAAAAGKQVRRLPRRLLSPLQNLSTFPSLASDPLGEFIRGALKECRCFSGSFSYQSSQENFQSPESLITSLFPLISAVGHCSGEFFSIQENSKTLVTELEGMMASIPGADRGMC